jgi:hydroxyacyl-ACP dehydratase HTD2-like protein with hotdog domain
MKLSRCLSQNVARYISSVKELSQRPPYVTFDQLAVANSRLLDLTLADFLHPAIQSKASKSELRGIRDTEGLLPQGHHLVYFPTLVGDTALLPDGTDQLQWPGLPFTRRLWAGGSIQFNKSASERALKFYNGDEHVPLPRKRGTEAVSVETIKDVEMKGLPGQEKVYVQIEKRMGYSRFVNQQASASLEQEGLNGIQDAERKLWAEEEGGNGQSLVVEKRTLVFLRPKTVEEANRDIESPERFLKPPAAVPDFSVTLTPTPSLLFRFSALTFNAHRIHLDPRYAREEEGYRNTLVHGPLSLVLMLTTLSSQLPTGHMIYNFTYRNLAPLYSGEEMKVCLKKSVGNDNGDERSGQLDGTPYEVWIEGKDGSLAVRGKATCGVPQTSI